jgi:hypothetical protein
VGRPLHAEPEVAIRRARPGDAGSIDAIASLDGARPLDGEVLLAEVGGTPVAAIDLHSGRAVADPFAPSAPAVGLLRLHAEQLRAATRAGGRRRRRRQPFAAITGLLR